MSSSMAENKATSPDFVKKLFQMLGEHEYEHIVRWAPQGDSFLVLDTNEFTKIILPRHFKHSNFASFVRQLNKYDFHKVRQADQALEGNPHGEGAWEFKHPEFNIHNGDNLDNIKRKAPAAKRVGKADNLPQSLPSPILNGSSFYASNDMKAMQHQIDSMSAMQSGMNNHLQALTRNYQQVISEMLNFQRNMVAQDQVMQNLISYLMNHAHGDVNSNMSGINGDEHAQKLVDEYSEVARQSYEQIEGMTRRASHLGLLADQGQHQQQHHQHHSQHNPHPWPQYDAPVNTYPQYQQNYDPNSGNAAPPPQSYNPFNNQINQATEQSPGNYSGSNESQTPNGNSAYQPSQVYQQQQHALDQRRNEENRQMMQQQQQQKQGSQNHHPQQQNVQITQHQQSQQLPKIQHMQTQHQQQQIQHQQHQRMQTPKEERIDPLQHRSDHNDRLQNNLAPTRKFEFTEQAASMIRAVKSGKKQITPWVSPPKILLVEDDAVCRRLSSKFLTFFGCDIDTAVDGVSAVNQMNEKKYDLVLMDIMMPNLDGVSATSLIRQFDPLTPIISMTSNVESGDVMTYFSHGMNDILPKPFTKDGLLGMLEKHLIHLKTLKQQGLNGQDRKPFSSIEGLEAQEGEHDIVSEADYLSMLSGLVGNNGIMPPGGSNGSAGRRSVEDMRPGEQEQMNKRTKLDENH